jgi:hypothetical protein
MWWIRLDRFTLDRSRSNHTLFLFLNNLTFHVKSEAQGDIEIKFWPEGFIGQDDIFFLGHPRNSASTARPSTSPCIFFSSTCWVGVKTALAQASSADRQGKRTLGMIIEA